MSRTQHRWSIHAVCGGSRARGRRAGRGSSAVRGPPCWPEPVRAARRTARPWPRVTSFTPVTRVSPTPPTVIQAARLTFFSRLLSQNQRGRRVLEGAGSHAPASVVVAHRQYRTGDGQVQPYRPRIVRCERGDDRGATVGITGMAALAQGFFCPIEFCPIEFCPIEQGRPLDANHGLPLRPPQDSSAGPLEGQHPSGQCHGQRREAVTSQPRQPRAREGMEAARAPRIGGVVSTSDAGGSALGSRVSRIAGAARQRKEQFACLPGHFVGPHHPQPVHGRSQIRVEFCGQARPDLGTGREIRYKAISPAHGDLLSHVANPRVTLDPRLLLAFFLVGRRQSRRGTKRLVTPAVPRRPRPSAPAGRPGPRRGSARR
jgi:hypothetical protein